MDDATGELGPAPAVDVAVGVDVSLASVSATAAPLLVLSLPPLPPTVLTGHVRPQSQAEACLTVRGAVSAQFPGPRWQRRCHWSVVATIACLRMDHKLRDDVLTLFSGMENTGPNQASTRSCCEASSQPL